MPTFVKPYEEKEGPLCAEANGRFDSLYIQNQNRSEVCFVCDGYKCTTISELISLCRYTPESVLGRKVIISIKDKI